MVTGSAEKVFSSSKNKLNPCKIKGFRTKYGGNKGFEPSMYLKKSTYKKVSALICSLVEIRGFEPLTS